MVWEESLDEEHLTPGAKCSEGGAARSNKLSAWRFLSDNGDMFGYKNETNGVVIQTSHTWLGLLFVQFS